MSDLMWLARASWNDGSASNDVYFGLDNPVFHMLEHYAPVTAEEGDTVVPETIPLFGLHTNENQLRRDVARLNAVLSRAKDFVQDDTRGDSEVFLYWQPGNMALPQRALVYGGRVDIIWDTGSDPHFREGGSLSSLHIRLRIMRHAEWETITSQYKLEDEGNISGFGGALLVDEIIGDQPARIERFSILAESGTGDTKNFWIGLSFRETPQLVLAECEDGTIGTDTATALIGAGASGGSVMRTTFSTVATLAKRFTITYDVTDLDLVGGTYLVLMRARLTSAGTVGMQMRTGYPGYLDDSYTRNPEVLFTSTAWRIVPMGYIQIPPYPRQSFPGGPGLTKFTWQFWAERLAGGSPNLEWDAFITLPTDGYGIIEGGHVGVAVPMHTHTRYDDRIYVVPVAAGPIPGDSLPASMEFVNWHYRPHQTEVFLVAERAASHVLTDTYNLQSLHAPRSLNYLSDQIFEEITQ